MAPLCTPVKPCPLHLPAAVSGWQGACDTLPGVARESAPMTGPGRGGRGEKPTNTALTCGN
ncbi:hypothetical protein JOC24_002384 [Streptomyces sp. HB132]|nr:hypothetical protein [Streptomyces sp. HB132]